MTNEHSPKVEVGTAGAVVTGHHATLNQEIVNRVLQERYTGKNARLRNAIKDDLARLPLTPEGKAKDDLIAAINARTTELAKRDQRSPGERWFRRSVVFILIAVLIGAGIFFIVPISERRAAIAHGHPDTSLVKQWYWGFDSLLNGWQLSPRGNRTLGGGESAVVEISRREENGDRVDHVYFSFKLISLNHVTACDQEAQDQTPHPKNGQFIVLEFEVTIGDYKMNGVNNPISRADFVAFDLDGKRHDTGQTSGSECVLA